MGKSSSGVTYNNSIEKNCVKVVKECLVVERIGGLEDNWRKKEVEKQLWCKLKKVFVKVSIFYQ